LFTRDWARKGKRKKREGKKRNRICPDRPSISLKKKEPQETEKREEEKKRKMKRGEKGVIWGLASHSFEKGGCTERSSLIVPGINRRGVNVM